MFCFFKLPLVFSCWCILWNQVFLDTLKSYILGEKKKDLWDANSKYFLILLM